MYGGPRFLRQSSPDQGPTKSPKLSSLLKASGVSNYISEIESPSVLEIGCASAIPLTDYSRELKIKDSFILEPDPFFSESFPPDITVISSLDSLNQKVNVVIMMHCLEHISIYRDILSMVYRSLHSGGYLCIEVPDLDLYDSYWYYHVGHTVHFSSKSMSILASQLGFEVTYVDHNSNHRYDTRSGLFIVLRKP